MFPAPKKVGFKAPLTEEIVTSRFTMRHSDIGAGQDESVSTLDLNEAAEEGVEVAVEEKDAESKSPHTGDKRESEDEEEREDESYPTTPVAGRRKRHRQWRWTLGPVESEEGSTAESSPRETDAEGASREGEKGS